MKTIEIIFKSKCQVGNGIITQSNKLVSQIIGGAENYWNRYQDEQAKNFLAKKALEYEYGYSKSKEMIIIETKIN